MLVRIISDDKIPSKFTKKIPRENVFHTQFYNDDQLQRWADCLKDRPNFKYKIIPTNKKYFIVEASFTVIDSFIEIDTLEELVDVMDKMNFMAKLENGVLSLDYNED